MSYISTPVGSSGVYTPTRSAEANLDSNATMTEAQYMRVGNTVTVSGQFAADPTLTATTTSFEITLPVASNIGAIEDVSGVANCGNIVSLSGAITGLSTGSTTLTAQFRVQTGGAGAGTGTFVNRTMWAVPL